MNSAAFAILVAIAISLLESALPRSLVLTRKMTESGPPTVQEVSAAIWLVVRAGCLLVATVYWLKGDSRRTKTALVVMCFLLTLNLLGSSALLVVRLLTNVPVSPLSLAGDAVIILVINVLVFALWYWLIDSEAIDYFRPSGTPTWDFLFPQRAAAITGYESWRPRFIDYIFLAYTMSVAFSPAETAPISRRAKLLTMTESIIALIAIVVVASSALNQLGGG